MLIFIILQCSIGFLGVLQKFRIDLRFAKFFDRGWSFGAAEFSCFVVKKQSKTSHLAHPRGCVSRETSNRTMDLLQKHKRTGSY